MDRLAPIMTPVSYGDGTPVSETAVDSRPRMQGYSYYKTVSHHLLRRRARAAHAKLKAIAPAGVHYVVRKAARGPWRWRIEEWR